MTKSGSSFAGAMTLNRLAVPITLAPYSSAMLLWLGAATPAPGAHRKRSPIAPAPFIVRRYGREVAALRGDAESSFWMRSAAEPA